MPPAPQDIFDDERAGRIYRTAAQMIEERGFDGTSMNDIAKAVGMTKPGVYYYVGGKKELLYAIMSFAMGRLERDVVEPASRLDDPQERLRAIVREHARLLTLETGAAGAVAVLMNEVGGLSDEQREEIVGRKRNYFEFVRRTLEDLAADGRLRRLDTTVASFSLLGMVMWISRWFVPKGRLDGEDVVRDITEMAVAAVLQGAAVHGTTPDSLIPELPIQASFHPKETS